MPLTRPRPLSLVLLLAALGLGGCDGADVGVDPSGQPGAGMAPAPRADGSAGAAPLPTASPRTVSGAWLGVDDARNPGDARLAACTADLRALEGSLAATVGPGCTSTEPLRVVQSGPTFTIQRRVVACGEGSLRAESGGGSLDERTLEGRLDLTGETEVRTRFFKGTFDGDRLALAFDRLAVEDAIVQGECLVSPPLRVEVTVVP